MIFKFLMAKNDIKGLPGLEKGDAVIRVAVEVMEGGYEYDVWHKLVDGTVAKTRIEHREEFEEHVTDIQLSPNVIANAKGPGVLI